MSELYLLRKRGYYYRPNAQGYCASVSDAGLYSEQEVLDRATIPGLTAIPVSSMKTELLAEAICLEHKAQEIRSALDHLNGITEESP